MQTYHTEILDADAPVDVYAENALRGQHLALIELDQGHITSPMQGSPVRMYNRATTARIWRDALYTGFEAAILVIPLEITPQLDTARVRLAGAMYSQASSPLSLSFKAYFASNPEQIDEVTLAWDTDAQLVELELSNPRKGMTYQDQLIVTLRNVLPEGEAAIGAAAHQVLTGAYVTEDGTWGDPFSPAYNENGPDNILWLEGEGWIEVGNFDSGDDRARVYNARKVYTTTGALVALTGWAARSCALDITGADNATIAPAQPELYPNIAVRGAVHYRHSLVIDRARDHRRYLSIRPSGAVLDGSELSQRSPFRRASALEPVLMRDSIYLDRGARGLLTLYPAILYVTGEGLLNADAAASAPDREDTQAFTLRLSQWEDGETTPTALVELDVDVKLRGWHERSVFTTHRALVDARRWRWSYGVGRLEETSLDSGAGYRWGTLAPRELALLNAPRLDLSLEGLSFDADLPLIVELEAGAWALPANAVLYAVGGAICWEGP